MAENDQQVVLKKTLHQIPSSIHTTVQHLLLVFENTGTSDLKPKFAKVISIVEEKIEASYITHISEKDIYICIFMCIHTHVYNMEAGDEQDIYTRNYVSRNSEISGSAVSHLYIQS